MRTALFWVIRQRVVVILTDVSGKRIGPILGVGPEDGTDMLF
jgi:hypothetical protein